MLVVTAINFLAAIWMFHNMTPELKVERKLFSMDAVKKLVGNGIWNSINSLGVTLNSGLDLLVTNLLLTNLQMGQIAITKTIASIFSSLEAMLCQPFQPLLLKSYSDNNKEQLQNLFQARLIFIISMVMRSRSRPLKSSGMPRLPKKAALSIS